MHKYMLLAALIGFVQVGCTDDPATASQTQGVGVTGAAFYYDGQLYRTVGTPTTLPQTAPDDSFDIIYALGQCQSHNVANAGPGSRDYNGGRWRVHLVSFADCQATIDAYDTNGSGDLDSAAEVEAAIADGAAADLGVVKSFVCPVIPLSH